MRSLECRMTWFCATKFLVRALDGCPGGNSVRDLAPDFTDNRLRESRRAGFSPGTASPARGGVAHGYDEAYDSYGNAGKSACRRTARTDAALAAGAARRAERVQLGRRQAVVLRRWPREFGRAAPAAHPQRQRCGLGLRGEADLRALPAATSRVRARLARIRFFRTQPTPLHAPPDDRRGAGDDRRDPPSPRPGADRRAGRFARLRVSRARGVRVGGRVGQPGPGQPDRVRREGRGSRPARQHARHAAALRGIQSAALEPGPLLRAHHPAEHPLLPRKELGAPGNRRGRVRVCVADHASAGSALCTL